MKPTYEEKLTDHEVEAFAEKCRAALKAGQPCPTLEDYVEQLNASLPEWELKRVANLVGVNLAGANLVGVNLVGVNLAGAKLGLANLARADLAGTNLAWTDLEGANLAWTDLEDANLAGANLAGANLAGANLAGANLAGANLILVNLAGADLQGANLQRAYLIKTNLIKVKNFPEAFVDYRKNTINIPEQLLNVMREELAKPSPDKDFLAQYRSFVESTLALSLDPRVSLTPKMEHDLAIELRTIRTNYPFSSLSPQDQVEIFQAAAKYIPEIHPHNERSDAIPVSNRFELTHLKIMTDSTLPNFCKAKLLTHFKNHKTLLPPDKIKDINAISDPKQRKEAFNIAMQAKLIEILSMGEGKQQIKAML